MEDSSVIKIGDFVTHVTNPKRHMLVVDANDRLQITCRFVSDNGVFTATFQPSELIKTANNNAETLRNRK